MQPEPFWPVAAQLEKVVVVHESCRLELGNELADIRGSGVNRADRNEASFDPELVWRGPEPSVEYFAGEPARFVSGATDEDRRRIRCDRQCHAELQVIRAGERPSHSNIRLDTLLPARTVRP